MNNQIIFTIYPNGKMALGEMEVYELPQDLDKFIMLLNKCSKNSYKFELQILEKK